MIDGVRRRVGLYVGFVVSFLSSLSDLELTRFIWFGTGPENPETSGNSAVPTENANHDTAADSLSVPPTAASPDQNQNSNVLFSAVSNLNAQLTALNAALPPRTAFLLFSGQ